MIGFSCGEGGVPSACVSTFESLLQEHNYPRLRNYLSKGEVAERCLAAIVCQKLDSLNKISLNAFETEQIKQIKLLKETVTYCSGCTTNETVEVKDLFNKNNSPFLIEFSFWIKSLGEL